MGPEYARDLMFLLNGKRLQIIGAANGQFVKSDYSPVIQKKEIFIFFLMT